MLHDVLLKFRSLDHALTQTTWEGQFKMGITVPVESFSLELASLLQIKAADGIGGRNPSGLLKMTEMGQITR